MDLQTAIVGIRHRSSPSTMTPLLMVTNCFSTSTHNHSVLVRLGHVVIVVMVVLRGGGGLTQFIEVALRVDERVGLRLAGEGVLRCHHLGVQ